MARPTWTLLPDPEPSPRAFPVISVDDHITEPPDVFAGRLPRHLADRAPQIVDMPDGTQTWAFENAVYFDYGLGVVAGRPREEWRFDGLRFEEMRRGCWDVHARVRDMDLDGVWASLCFPSMTWGFAGRVLSLAQDGELGLAAIRAWNAWNLEEWTGAHPDRLIPLQMPYLRDPVVAAAEIRANAERGFTAVTFVDAPHRLGLPPITDHAHWAPFLTACEETGTVVCLHTGASGHIVEGSPGAALNVGTTLFPAGAFAAAIDWTWARVPTRYPELKLALSEGGIGWVPMAIDRLDYVIAHSAGPATGDPWTEDLSPSEALRRNFYFCMLDDPTTLPARHTIGVDHIMFETDYPHADSTWPHTQALLTERLGDLPADEAEAIAFRNAARLFRHPPPAEGWAASAPAPGARTPEAAAG
jgi:predicted TIM-barrel fold metal-dependent hydrolase